MHLASNIKFLRKRKGLTQEDLSNLLDIKRSTLNGYENNISRPSVEILIKLSDFFGFSIDSMIRVNLISLSESNIREMEMGSDPYIRGTSLRIIHSTIDSKNNENIEMIPEKAKAGYTTGFADPEFISELPRYQLPHLSKNKKFRSFQLSGDSMLPIPDGAWVTGEFIQDWNTIKDGSPCIVLTLSDGIVFKTLENRIHREGGFIAHSLNPAYSPYFIAANEIKEIWKFNHFISNTVPQPSDSKDEILSALQQLQKEIYALKNNYRTNQHDH